MLIYRIVLTQMKSKNRKEVKLYFLLQSQKTKITQKKHLFEYFWGKGH